ncbi:DUF1150 domain-containing protein [Ponticoccus gilvus]|nr:DUF1150 domain-containing protein [Enemella evansiae]
MHTKYDFGQFEQGQVVYVRAVKAQDLPEEVRSQIGPRDTLYAVHRSDGERLALVKDRSLAFVLARQNDFAPVTVH